MQVILYVFRFGESDLHKCEVMLKDVADSKRINTNIAERKELAHKRTGTVVEEVTSSESYARLNLHETQLIKCYVVVDLENFIKN